MLVLELIIIIIINFLVSITKFSFVIHWSFTCLFLMQLGRGHIGCLIIAVQLQLFVITEMLNLFRLANSRKGTTMEVKSSWDTCENLPKNRQRII